MGTEPGRACGPFRGWSRDVEFDFDFGFGFLLTLALTFAGAVAFAFAATVFCQRAFGWVWAEAGSF